MDQPFSIRSLMVSRLMPTIRAHCWSVRVSPFAVSLRLLRLLLACARAVAQMQFSGEYGPLLSMRSSIRPSGFMPISSRNLSKVVHRSQQTIPRAPYEGYFSFFGLLQRCRIWLQTRCVFECVIPCTKPGFGPQPHDVLEPETRLAAKTSFLTPQSHTHAHLACRDGTGLRWLTSHFPKRLPARSVSFPLMFGMFVGILSSVNEVKYG